MRRLFAPVLLLLTLLLPAALRAQFPAPCDTTKACIGNALTTSVTAGKGAQYVDVDSNYRLRGLSGAITFEAWIKPEQQSGRRQFVAGLWGPNRDNNDSWAIWIEGETITFTLSPDLSFQGDLDNTTVTYTLSGLYTRGWTHLACVWDSATTAARIIIDGYEAARATNPAFPLVRLKQAEDRKLLTQICATNALYDDTVRFRTFKGQMDEIRIWNRALAETEIRCQRDLSLEGNEPGLVVYYRCNEGQNMQNLCDATGHGIYGRMRSGAAGRSSDRTLTPTIVISPASIDQTLYCTSDTTLTFTITDTSICGSQASLQMVGPDGGLFSLSQNSLTLVQNVPQVVTVRLRATVIGSITARLRVNRANRCNAYVESNIHFQRRTELDYNKGRMFMDTLFVGCQERTFNEDTLQICNNTGRPMRIDSARLTVGDVMTWRPRNPAQTLPITLQNGECWYAVVRMSMLPTDTSKTQRDTLIISSDDRCAGSGIVPIYGRIQEVLAIWDPNGDPVDSLEFGAVCPGQISDVRLYQYRNLVQERIALDTIAFDDGFYGRRFIFPLQLDPNTAYLPNYIRFRPTRPGDYYGRVRFVTHYRGCTIEKSIYLHGRGISVDVSFNSSVVGFGSVRIGTTATQTAPVTNNGLDTRKMSAYLKVGDVFTITSNRSFVIVPGQTIPIGLTFRPREPITYYDTLCVFDEECFQTICIPVSGTGTFDALSFSPSYLRMENVVGCQCRIDTMTVTNISGGALGITSARLNDGTGKFRVIGTLPSGTLAASGTAQVIIEYCPNDLVNDRADEAFLEFNLSNGQLYEVLVRGTSVVPKLYVTPLTTYGPVEVGWQRRDSILVENASSVPVHVTGVSVPSGYTVLSTTPTLPTTLAPRDSMWVYVEFKPTAEIAYNGPISIQSDSPCNLMWEGDLEGSGKIVRLDVPVSFINYGLIKPCDCAEREIPLPNASEFIPMSIDSVWIDGAGVPSARPQIFRWRSRQTGDTTLPYTITPGSIDTLVVSFCPNIPSIPQNILSNAVIHIKASTRDWNEEFQTVLSGRRELNFQPNRVLVSFPATRVDTSATPIPVQITVPDAFQNPSGDSIIITGISFAPDQRVFSVTTVPPRPFPWVIHRGDTFRFFVNFYPRAPKDYVARLHMETSYPCAGTDTTIQVKGSGFAPAYGMQVAFDTAALGRDTLRITTCDTLVVPIMITRDIPQPLIDMIFRVGYDSTAVQLLDIASPFTPIASVRDTGDGARAILKNAANVPAGTIATLRFVPRGGAAAFPLVLDEIDFDSDSIVFFKIVANIDRAWVIIDDPQIAIEPIVDFDTVNLKTCDSQVIRVWNPGTTPVRFDSLSALPRGYTMAGTSLPVPVTLAPGDTVMVTVMYCPRVEEEITGAITASSSFPCPIIDTGALHSVGFAPPFPMRFLLAPDSTQSLTLGGAIADTVEMPIYLDRDCPMTPLDVTMSLNYNRRALQYLSVRSIYSPTASAVEGPNGIRITLPGCDSLKKGEIARVRFAVAVPDTVLSPVVLVPEPFASDSIFFIKINPPYTQGDTGMVRVDPKCNISRLTFRSTVTKMSAPTPNPAREVLTVEAEMLEDTYAQLTLIDAAGREVLRPVDGTTLLPGGRYRFEFSVASIASGEYFVVLQARKTRLTERVSIRR